MNYFYDEQMGVVYIIIIEVRTEVTGYQEIIFCKNKQVNFMMRIPSLN